MSSSETRVFGIRHHGPGSARAATRTNAAAFAALGALDPFPEMMAAALQKRDLNQWAAARGVNLERAVETSAP